MTNKIHAIALTKNEEDIVEACLREALLWADFIYVYDGASEDRTWEIVKGLSSEEPRIVAWKQDGKVFSEGLRGEVFNEFRNRSSEGDWWCQLNIDEFFIDSPRGFLSQVPKHEHVVWGKFAQYYITEEDLDKIDFSQSFSGVRDSIKFYEMLPTSEARFFRYRKGLEWSTEWAWPKHMGVNHRKRIGIRHYPYRSPNQIQMRFDVRRDNRERGFPGWDHACKEGWREAIRDRRQLTKDDGSQSYALPAEVESQHVEKRLHRLIKRIMHALGFWA